VDNEPRAAALVVHRLCRVPSRSEVVGPNLDIEQQVVRDVMLMHRGVVGLVERNGIKLRRVHSSLDAHHGLDPLRQLRTEAWILSAFEDLERRESGAAWDVVLDAEQLDDGRIWICAELFSTTSTMAGNRW